MRLTRGRVATRTTPRPTEGELQNGIPVFLDQLCDAIRRSRATDVVDHGEIRETASRHGHDLLGLTSSARSS